MKRKSHADAILEILRRERRKRVRATTRTPNDKTHPDGATAEDIRPDERHPDHSGHR
jgi:hypothetical protein